MSLITNENNLISISDNDSFIFMSNQSTDQLIMDNSLDNQLCICCLDLEGNIRLCLKCKYRYCLNCSKKLDNKCCICFRLVKEKYYYNDEHPVIYVFPYNYITLLTGWIMSIILFILGILGTSFFMILLSKMIVNFVFFSLSNIMIYVYK